MSYSWSHSIDNQSEPLRGDFFDLSFTRIGGRRDFLAVSAFSRQFDSGADRGNSDFDQRHNLVVHSIWESAVGKNRVWSALIGGWSIAQLAAFRSGFPYTVFGASGTPDAGG